MQFHGNITNKNAEGTNELIKQGAKYVTCLQSRNEAKDILANESDADLKEMAREELQTNELLQPKIEEEIDIEKDKELDEFEFRIKEKELLSNQMFLHYKGINEKLKLNESSKK